MIIFGGVGLSYKAIDGTGGGGVAGLPIEADKTVGGSGIIIVVCWTLGHETSPSLKEFTVVGTREESINHNNGSFVIHY